LKLRALKGVDLDGVQDACGEEYAGVSFIQRNVYGAADEGDHAAEGGGFNVTETPKR